MTLLYKFILCCFFAFALSVPEPVPREHKNLHTNVQSIILLCPVRKAISADNAEHKSNLIICKSQNHFHLLLLVKSPSVTEI